MTKHTLILTGLIGVTALAIVGCRSKQEGKFSEEQMQAIPYASRADLPEASGGMTLGIYSETITVDEILLFMEERLKPFAGQVDRETFQNQALSFIRETVKGKVTDILLYQEARKTAPENIDEMIQKAVESETARFVAGFDNNYAIAERAIKQMGMDWKSFRDYQKKLILTQSFISTKLNEEKRFSHQDLVDHYETIKDEVFTTEAYVEFSIIDIRPSQLTADQIGENQSPQQAAQDLAERLLDRIIAGEDFAALAKEHSHGPFAKLGGRLERVSLGTNSLAEPYATLEQQAIRMQPGQTQGPIVIDEHVFILHLNDIQRGAVIPFTEVQDQIAQQLQFQHRQKNYQQFVQKLLQKTDAAQLESFSRFCTRVAYDRWGRDALQ